MFDDMCLKCGMYRAYSLERSRVVEPWCSRCIRENPAEYKSIIGPWVNENATDVLKSMCVPSAYRTCSFSSFENDTKDQRRALRAAESWTEDGNLGLFLCGPCGTGKTHLATAALLAMRARDFSGRFLSAQELLLQCRDSFRNDKGLEDVLEEYCKADVLLIDDLGSENPTPFARETIGLLIDRAYRESQSLIVTSNYDFEALAERIDARTVDRLIERCVAVKLTGTSYRQKLAGQRASFLSRPASKVVQ